MRGLLAGGADIYKASSTGCTPVLVAGGKGHIAVVQSLLTAGADMNMADEKGLTPLYTATGKGHIEVVQSLLTAGADLTRKNRDGLTALDIANERGHKERSPSCGSKRPEHEPSGQAGVASYLLLMIHVIHKAVQNHHLITP